MKMPFEERGNMYGEKIAKVMKGWWAVLFLAAWILGRVL